MTLSTNLRAAHILAGPIARGREVGGGKAEVTEHLGPDVRRFGEQQVRRHAPTDTRFQRTARIDPSRPRDPVVRLQRRRGAERGDGSSRMEQSSAWWRDAPARTRAVTRVHVSA
jgi:hypothetical protein